MGKDPWVEFGYQKTQPEPNPLPFLGEKPKYF